MAISHGMTVIGWRENLVEKEMPPEWSWPLDHELEVWFEDVEAARKAKYGIEDDDDEPDMVSNELSRKRRK